MIAIIGKSTLEYFVSLLGLSRLGYSVLLLSPRLATEAAVSLLDCTKCSTLVYMREFQTAAERIQKERVVQILRTPERDEFDRGLPTGLDWKNEQVGAGDRTAFIMHSSGSTGLPKPIFQTHRACLENFENGNSLRSFLTAPLYHTFGFASLFRTISKGGLLYMYDHNLPLASNYLLEALGIVQPETFFGVPYALKLLAETQQGIDALARCGSVIVAGASCPDELGDRLVANGVHLIVTFGATECGQVATSRRPKGDTSWNYLRFYPNVKPYVLMQPAADDLHELVILDGLRSKVVSNSNDPPNSFHSRDLFSPHPAIPDAWKYVGRMDDRITLVNGEKVLPLPIEGRIRDHPLVTEAVVFGIQRDFPGLLVFKGPQAQDLSDDEFLENIWPAVEDANSRAEGFSQISKQAIIPVASGTSYPQTDKGTIIRAKVYLAFESEINTMYEAIQQDTCGDERPDMPTLQKELLNICRDELGLNIEDVEDDLFNAGMDSLKAARLSNTIRKKFFIESEEKRKKLGADVIYRNMTIARVASYIKDAEDVDAASSADLDLMKELIDKYSDFSHIVPPQIQSRSSSTTDCSTVLLTGVTGSLGCHILKTLLDSTSTKKVICIVRIPNSGNSNDDTEAAKRRILDSLEKREVDVTPDAFSKVVALPGDLSNSDFGKILHKNHDVLQSTTTIIHAAWPVDFNFSLESFRTQLSSLHALLSLSLQVDNPPARLLFCSSISTALATPSPATIPESLPSQLKHAQSTGYAQSKLCAEYILNNASVQAGADTVVARIGQIVADTKAYIWNTNEAIPLMVRSANAIQSLPDLKGEQCQWLPVDECAKTICELIATPTENRGEGAQFFNVLHPRAFSWTDDFLPALRQAGFMFDIVPVSEWLRRLEKSEQNPQTNPSIKLLGFWKGRWGSGARIERDIQFDTRNAQRRSDSLDRCSSVVESNLLLNLATRWYQEWKG